MITRWYIYRDGYCDNILVEEKPYCFYDRSLQDYDEDEKHVDKKIIDELEYKREWVEKIHHTVDFKKINYDNIDFDNNRFNYCEIDGKEKVRVKRTIVDIPPFLSARFYYADCDNIGMVLGDYNVRTINDSAHPYAWGKHSDNPYANILLNLCEHYGIEYDRRSLWSDRHRWHEYDDLSAIKFKYFYTKYGYGNSLYIIFTLKDIVTMDVRKFVEIDRYREDYKGRKELSYQCPLSRLREFCENEPMLKQILNFDVFERPLTDNEIAKCYVDAMNYIIAQQKYQDKHKYDSYYDTCKQ